MIQDQNLKLLLEAGKGAQLPSRDGWLSLESFMVAATPRTIGTLVPELFLEGKNTKKKSVDQMH